jgi:hypothetical protein
VDELRVAGLRNGWAEDRRLWLGAGALAVAGPRVGRQWSAGIRSASCGWVEGGWDEKR